MISCSLEVKLKTERSFEFKAIPPRWKQSSQDENQASPLISSNHCHYSGKRPKILDSIAMVNKIWLNIFCRELCGWCIGIKKISGIGWNRALKETGKEWKANDSKRLLHRVHQVHQEIPTRIQNDRRPEEFLFGCKEALKDIGASTPISNINITTINHTNTHAQHNHYLMSLSHPSCGLKTIRSTSSAVNLRTGLADICCCGCLLGMTGTPEGLVTGFFPVTLCMAGE